VCRLWPRSWKFQSTLYHAVIRVFSPMVQRLVLQIVRAQQPVSSTLMQNAMDKAPESQFLVAVYKAHLVQMLK
jgi:hypothetical protein